jgi:hypothetical protein
MRARLLLAATALTVSTLTPHVQAQHQPPVRDGKVSFELVLKPTDFLKPISRAYLLPEFAESIPGNRVQMFLRCFMEQEGFFGLAESERRERWNQLPLDKLPLKDVKDYGAPQAQAIYDAARMTHADWQLWYFMRRDGYKTLLPDVQKMRHLAVPLKTRVRGELAEGDFPGALHTLKSMFSLARTLDSNPTLVADLVGIAIGTIATDAVEEFIQQPGAPNLFWSLADLPSPFISLRLGVEGERLMFSQDIQMLKSSEGPAPESEIERLIGMMEEILVNESGPGSKPKPGQYRGQVRDRVNNAEEVGKARERLNAAGVDRIAMGKWSPQHIVLLDEFVRFELLRDELTKWMDLPFYRAKDGLESTAKEIKREPANWAAVALLPAMEKVKRAQVRLDQRLAYVQVIEAIRLHAFKNGGALPATLEEIKLPLPADPVSGKPFEYAAKNGVATLHGENPNDMPETNRYYMIRIAK